MKKVLLFWMGILLVGGCSKNEEPGGDYPSLTLTATMGAFASLDQGSTLQLKWPADVEVGLFEFDVQSQLFLNSNRKFSLSQGAGSAEAVFDGASQSSDGWSNGEKLLYAYYPYNPAQMMASAVSFAIPAVQTQSVADPLAHIVGSIFMTTTQALSSGHASAAALTLQQALTILRFNITNQTDNPLSIDKLVLSVRSALLHKSGVYSFRHNQYTFSPQDRTAEVCLFTDEPVTLAVGESMPFYVALLPLTLPLGGELIMEVHTNRDVATAKMIANPAEIVFGAGKILTSPIVINEITFATPKTIVLPEGQNSFMVAPSDNGLDTYLLLPVTRVNDFWASNGSTNMIGDATPWVAEIIWQDFDVTGAGEVLTITPLQGQGIGPNTRIGLTLKNYPQDQWGNAVVGIKRSDGNGNPVSDWLWSWHIWITDFVPENAVTYSGSNAEAMDRHLGAKDKTPGSAGALGLMYQWGRKDPFPGAVSIAAGTTARAATTLGSWPVEPPQEGGTYPYAAQHPTTFITAVLNNSGNPNIGDWLLAPNLPFAWQNTTKPIQDPCPKGWKVAKVDGVITWSDFVQGTTFIFDAVNLGYTYRSVDWYPLAGRLHPLDGGLEDVGSVMYVATGNSATRTIPQSPGYYQPPLASTLNGLNNVSRCILFSTTNGTNNDNNALQRASGTPIRCIRYPGDDN